MRPALEALPDLAAQGCVDVVLCSSPDRLARKFAYQALLIEEFARAGVRVEFIKGPRGDSPEELMVQFQGMFAEYEKAQLMERAAPEYALLHGIGPYRRPAAPRDLKLPTLHRRQTWLAFLRHPRHVHRGPAALDTRMCRITLTRFLAPGQLRVLLPGHPSLLPAAVPTWSGWRKGLALPRQNLEKALYRAGKILEVSLGRLQIPGVPASADGRV